MKRENINEAARILDMIDSINDKIEKLNLNYEEDTLNIRITGANGLSLYTIHDDMYEDDIVKYIMNSLNNELCNLENKYKKLDEDI